MVSSGSQAGYPQGGNMPQGGASGSSYPPQSGAMPQGGSAGASYPRPQMGQQGQPGRKPGVGPVSHVCVYACACVHVPGRAMCTLSLSPYMCVCTCIHACVCAHVVINLLVCLNCSLFKHFVFLFCSFMCYSDDMFQSKFLFISFKDHKVLPHLAYLRSSRDVGLPVAFSLPVLVLVPSPAL